MKVECTKCNKVYRIPDDRVPAGRGAVKVRCKNCGNVMDVHVSGPGETGIQEKRWFVAFGNDKQGPMAIEQVFSLIRSGEIGMETYVWRKGFKEWQRLGDVPELAPAVSAHRVVQPEATSPLAPQDFGVSRTAGEVEPTVMESITGGAFAGEPRPTAPLWEQGSQTVSQAPFGGVEEAPTQEEDTQTKMIWQRRETSVLFSLDDYRSRRKTRTAKASTAPPPVVRVQPIEAVREEVPPKKGTERVNVISLEEAEVKRVAEALGRRQRRRALVRKVLIGVSAGAVVAVAAFVVSTRFEEREAPTPQDQVAAAQPTPAVLERAAEPQPPPVAPPTPSPGAEAPAPSQEPLPETLKDRAKPHPAPGKATAQRPASKPARGEAARPAPVQGPQEKSPPPSKPAMDDVNALLANLRTGQAGGPSPSGSGSEKAAPESGEALPEQLTMGQIQSVLRRQQKPVEECIRKSGVAPGTTVMVTTRVEIEGSGRVTSASVSNAGAAEGCIRSLLTGLRFPRFKGANMTVPYPFRVSL